MRLVTRLLFVLAIASLAIALPVTSAHADPILPGFDLLETLPGTYHDFTGPFAVPAGFFGPGSDPFFGRVDFQTVPMGPQPGCLGPVGNTGMLVHRPLGANPPCCPGQETVPIEIVALSLVSVNPITVTYGGAPLEHWRVEWNVSPSPPPPTGQMTVKRQFPNGGTFDSQLPVRPVFTFTKVQPQPEPPRVLDLGPSSFFDIFVSVDLPWSHTPLPSFEIPGCGSNFFPGVLSGSSEVPMESISFNYAKLVFRYTHHPDPTPTRVSTWGRIKSLYR